MILRVNSQLQRVCAHRSDDGITAFALRANLCPKSKVTGACNRTPRRVCQHCYPSPSWRIAPFNGQSALFDVSSATLVAAHSIRKTEAHHV